MSARTVGGRVLWVAADDVLRRTLPRDAGWVGQMAHSFEQARFLQQLDPSDVVILGGNDVNQAGLSILGLRRTAPLLYIADVGAEAARNALVDGATAWLPRQAVLDHPPLLTAALERLTIPRESSASRVDPPTSSRRTSRLVKMLWETIPAADQASWFSQRHMLDRLQEEISRCSRHGGQFSLILGEMQTGRHTPRPASARRTAWAARLISRSKRRSDIIGQYGLSGFLLLLPQTAEEPGAVVLRRLQGLLQRAAETARPRSLRVQFGLASYRSADTAIALLCRAEKYAMTTSRYCENGVPV